MKLGLERLLNASIGMTLTIRATSSSTFWYNFEPVEAPQNEQPFWQVGALRKQYFMLMETKSIVGSNSARCRKLNIGAAKILLFVRAK